MPTETLRMVVWDHPLPSLEFLGRGNLAWVYIVNDKIALKVPKEEGDESFAQELRAYDFLETAQQCPMIAQTFLRLPNAIFMPHYRGGNLDVRLNERQIWSQPYHRGQVLEVTELEPVEQIERWVSQIADAVAWLEGLGYVHGDMAPRNILVDGDENLKLIDFEDLFEIGSSSTANMDPYNRLVGPEDPELKGGYEPCGPRTEQFAIGTLTYLLTRGFEPYDDQDLGGREHGPRVVDRFQDRRFPVLTDSHLDQLIHRCWWYHYANVRDLADEVKMFPGARAHPVASVFDSTYCLERRKECQRLVSEGLLKRGLKRGVKPPKFDASL